MPEKLYENLYRVIISFENIYTLAFYSNYFEYEKTMDRVEKMDLARIICPHDYEPCGFIALGDEQIEEMIAECRLSATKREKIDKRS